MDVVRRNVSGSTATTLARGLATVVAGVEAEAEGVQATFRLFRSRTITR